MNKSDNKILNIRVFETIKVSDFYKPKKKFSILPQIFPSIVYRWSFKDLEIIDNNFSLAPPTFDLNNLNFKITA